MNAASFVLGASLGRVPQRALLEALYPERGLHPSWLPAGWPAEHRAPQRRGAAGQAVLAQLLRERDGIGREPDLDYGRRLKRLLLLDSAALRTLAALMGFCLHAPLLDHGGAAAAQLLRQARRYGEGTDVFLRRRAPRLATLGVDTAALQRRPHAVGRTAVARGYKLLLAAAAALEPAAQARLLRKLPHRATLGHVPALSAAQQAEVEELIFLCILPERLAPWDWLS